LTVPKKGKQIRPAETRPAVLVLALRSGELNCARLRSGPEQELNQVKPAIPAFNPTYIVLASNGIYRKDVTPTRLSLVDGRIDGSIEEQVGDQLPGDPLLLDKVA
jgi:hypothetical protein